MRRTIVVHTKLSGHMARIAAARSGEHGVQILTMGQLAGRLAGGFLQPIDGDALQAAVREALSVSDLGDLDAIKNLPGMVRASIDTLDKVWRADIDLSFSEDGRLTALRRLEEEILKRLPPSMKRPRELVDLACGRLKHARAILGPVEIHGHTEMSPCWRLLLSSLAENVPVKWIAGAGSIPEWLDAMAITICRAEASSPSIGLFSCATPQHEALEAFRWMRELIASGKARPEEIAIAAASPGEFDDHILALTADANIPIHFVHGLRAVTTREGQAVAALAELLTKGISQERVRRLFSLLPESTPAISSIPRDWTRVLPKDAPLTTIERWRQAFNQLAVEDWPDGQDKSEIIIGVLELLDRGTEAALEVGDRLLTGKARGFWQKALADGPATALPVTLGQLRINDGLEPATHAIWTSAISLASAPRPHVRLLSLNAGRWPRRISEDRLIPDHIIPIEKLDPLPVADGDRRDFESVFNSAQTVTISFSRRDVGGRLLGRSPLINDLEETYLSRGRIPEHAASESDRLIARPTEFWQMPMAVAAMGCWRDWFLPEITAHDGLVGIAHPRLRKVFERPLSATSIKLLLRDPIRFVWRYALGWKQPEEAEEPLTIDMLAFGNLVHAVLQGAVDSLELGGGFGNATHAQKLSAVADSAASIALEWETEQPIPPPIIWRTAIDNVKNVALAALTYPLDELPGQKSWTEIPFGTQDASTRNDLPWDPSQRVKVPGSGVFIQGHIDRLDLSSDGSRARVLDYKTGWPKSKMDEVEIKGGGELQRCLYAFAVKTLLCSKVEVDAALLFPRAADEGQALFRLSDVDGALQKLANAIDLARKNLISGLALPGIDAADQYNDFAFLLPAAANYLPRKLPLAAEKLGEATAIWEAK